MCIYYNDLYFTASTEEDEASKSHTNTAPSLPPDNYKARLNEYCQKHYLPLPVYETEYPEDSTGYIAVVKVCQKEYISTVEMAKKSAEQKAAGLAALDLGIVQIETKKQDESPSKSQSEDSKSSMIILKWSSGIIIIIMIMKISVINEN